MTANVTPEIRTQLRNAPLADLVEMLREQEDVKYDVVVPAARLRYENGVLRITEAATRFDADGVTMDNYDVLLAVLDGVRKAGVDTSALHLEADVSETNMRVRVTAPEVTALAPTLLANYRSPFGGATARAGDDGGSIIDAAGNTLPIVQAGFVVSNSETGGGAFQIMPRIVVRVCNNGMTRKVDALRAVHLGGKLDEGIVTWSDHTKRTALELVVSKARDAVATFLDASYVERVVADVEQSSAKPVDTLPTLERVARVHAFTEAEAASVLDCFIKSGDATAGGVMQAVTATAQIVDDPDRAAYLEDVALDVLATAAAAN